MKKESEFQKQLINKITIIFPECIILKNDPKYIQGIPDLLILNKNKWAMIECKKSSNAHKQPNQEYYICKCNDMSYGKFVYPENEEEVIHELKEFFLE